MDSLWGKKVKLASGEVLTADQEYIRESILNPGAKIVAGYQLLMPVYRNQLNQDQVNQLVEYVRSLGHQSGTK